MPRNTNLDEILFPVELCDLFAEVNVVFVQRPLLDDSLEVRPVMARVPRHGAVVNTKTGGTLSVVSKDYRLVTNREALDLAGQCFRKVFDTVDLKQMEVFNIITPPSRASCHIDIIHKDYEVNIWKREVWLPYIRVTNSYNRSKALGFSLGFCRKVCDNGVIFERQTIEYRYYHTTGTIAPKGEFQVDFQRLQRFHLEFIEHMNNLSRFYVPPEHFLPLVCKALHIKFDLHRRDEKARRREQQRLQRAADRVRALTQKYVEVEELGPTAYAALAVISEFATYPSVREQQSDSTHRLQMYAGAWIEEFVEAVQERAFDFKHYLGEYLTMFSV